MWRHAAIIHAVTTTAADLGIPVIFNAATHFVDRHIHEGRGGAVAIECGDERVTYAELHERVNRFGLALRSRCDVRPEERVALLLLDGPEFAYAFFGAIKIGAVAIPTNTLWMESGGLSYIEVEVTGPNRDLHSGVYGGAVANPITILAKMIASCHDENNHITIPGFYDDVIEATPEERT